MDVIVTLTVPGLYRDCHPTKPTTPPVRVSLDVIVTLTVLGLSGDCHPIPPGLPPCRSIPGCHSNSDSPGTIQGLSSHQAYPLSEYPWMS